MAVVYIHVRPSDLAIENHKSEASNNPSTCRVVVTHQVIVALKQTENGIRNLQELKRTSGTHCLLAVAMTVACTYLLVAVKMTRRQ